jgi:hypothetical protein
MVYEMLCQVHIKEAALTLNQETAPLQKFHNPCFVTTNLVEEPHLNRMVTKSHMVESPVTYDFTLHSKVVTTRY